MKVIQQVNEKYANRPRANIVKWLMAKTGKSTKEVAGVLGCSVSYLNIKFHRDSFSIDDILVVANWCDYSVVLVDKRDGQQYSLDVEDAFRRRSEKVGYTFDMKIKYDKMKKEMEEMKTKVEQMERVYGFSDQ